MIAEVIVDIANSEVDRVFDYIARDDTILGQRVRVPFGNRYIDGYVIRLKNNSLLPLEKLKTIQNSIDEYPVLIEELLLLAQFMVNNNHLRYIDCLRLFVPTQLRSKFVKPLYINYVKVDSNFSADKYLPDLRKNAKKQKDMLLYLEADKIYLQAELNKLFGSNNVNKLINSGDLVSFKKHENRKPFIQKKQNKIIQLNNAQQDIVDSILIDNKSTHLIFGVTGSGKTEIYMSIINKVLLDGKNAILLVPEISLTPQIMSVFYARFGDNVALLHSGLSNGERFDEWQRIRLGQARIVIGARSAIFAPLKNIGAIIIDEEHDASYKSESNPRYNTHELAEFRAKYNNAYFILGSATPSIDSFYQARLGNYVLHELPFRANGKKMPEINIVNMCEEVKSGNNSIFSRQLLDELQNNINTNNQSILFLNRRGFSSYVICKECGYVAKCEDCDVSLVYHKEDNLLKCHYCNRRYKMLTECPECHSKNIRMGAMGTQRIVAELEAKFPNIPIFRLDVDNTKTKNSLTKILSNFANTKPSILVGTQMIAKGHDFPDVTLVGILDADMSLHFSDFRAIERTYQLITQVAGRAGRAEKTGQVILQTYTPKHYVYQFVKNYNYHNFFDKEINLRQVTNFPPFAKIIRILLSGENENEVRDLTSKIYHELIPLRVNYCDEFIYLSAMRSPVNRIQNKYRYQILIRLKSSNESLIFEKIIKIIDKYRQTKIQIFVEENPSNMS